MPQPQIIHRVASHPVIRGYGHWFVLSSKCGLLAAGMLVAVVVIRWILGESPLPEGVTVGDLLLTLAAVVVVPMVLGVVAGLIRYRQVRVDDELER